MKLSILKVAAFVLLQTHALADPAASDSAAVAPAKTRESPKAVQPESAVSSEEDDEYYYDDDALDSLLDSGDSEDSEDEDEEEFLEVGLGKSRKRRNKPFLKSRHGGSRARARSRGRSRARSRGRSRARGRARGRARYRNSNTRKSRKQEHLVESKDEEPEFAVEERDLSEVSADINELHMELPVFFPKDFFEGDSEDSEDEDEEEFLEVGLGKSRKRRNKPFLKSRHGHSRARARGRARGRARARHNHTLKSWKPDHLAES